MISFAKTLRILSTAALVLIGPAALAQETKRVELMNSAFSPVLVSVKVGDSVTWNYNDGSRPHSVRTQPGAPATIDSNPQCPPACMPAAGTTFMFKFEKPGTYNYYCPIHGQATPAPNPSATTQPCGMCGVVTVSSGSAPAPAPNTTPALTAGVRATPPRSAGPSLSPLATPVTTLSPLDTPAVTPELFVATPSPKALATSKDDDGNGGRVALIALALLALGGAGVVAVRRLGLKL